MRLRVLVAYSPVPLVAGRRISSDVVALPVAAVATTYLYFDLVASSAAKVAR